VNRAGYRTSLVVADGRGEEIKDGIEVIDVGNARGRLGRMTVAANRVYRAAKHSDAAICHFHDPELLPFGATLRRAGKIVVYDAHEDLGEDVRTKDYLPALLRYPIARAADFVERIAGGKLSAIVGATPGIAAKFQRYGYRSAEINNFPWSHELRLQDSPPMQERALEFVYVGGISVDRGLIKILKALALLEGPGLLNIAGSFSLEREQAVAEASPGWDRVRFLGQLGREDVAHLLGATRAGLVLFQPLANNVTGRPNKLFEYMSAALPVIASDYPGWREIVDSCGCGLLVDPQSPEAIAEAMQWILDHPAESQAMGERGRQAILTRYNWEAEAKKLIDLYEQLTGPGEGGARQ
jgi:glycosyltransferase involved in cell wall biosynthesis